MLVYTADFHPNGFFINAPVQGDFWVHLSPLVGWGKFSMIHKTNEFKKPSALFQLVEVLPAGSLSFSHEHADYERDQTERRCNQRRVILEQLNVFIHDFGFLIWPMVSLFLGYVCGGGPSWSPFYRKSEDK